MNIDVAWISDGKTRWAIVCESFLQGNSDFVVTQVNIRVRTNIPDLIAELERRLITQELQPVMLFRDMDKRFRGFHCRVMSRTDPLGGIVGFELISSGEIRESKKHAKEFDYSIQPLPSSM